MWVDENKNVQTSVCLVGIMYTDIVVCVTREVAKRLLGTGIVRVTAKRKADEVAKGQ